MEDKLDELIALERENNLMLKAVLLYLREHNDKKDFAMNYIANVLSNYKNY